MSSFAPAAVLTLHHFEVSENGRGYWVAKDKEGLIGGVFRTQKKAHPVVPGSSTYRGGGRNLKRGWVSSFSRVLSCLSHAGGSSTAFWPASECRDADRSQPLNARSRLPHGIRVPHIGLPGTTG